MEYNNKTKVSIYKFVIFNLLNIEGESSKYMQVHSRSHFNRGFESDLASRPREAPRFIQIIFGPRQVGKTSGVLNVLESCFDPSEYDYFSCEEGLHDSEWFLSNVQKSSVAKKKILVFDETQKIEK